MFGSDGVKTVPRIASATKVLDGCAKAHDRRCSVTRNVLRMILALATVVSLPALAFAEGRTCSGRELVGAWGYTETGTAIAPTGQLPSAAVGRYTFEPDGTFSGTQESSVNGTVNQDIKQGTYTLKADCTGTLALEVYNQEGALQRTSTWAIVVVENGNAVRGMMTSLKLGGITSVPAVITMGADRIFPGLDMSGRVTFPTLGQEPK